MNSVGRLLKGLNILQITAIEFARAAEVAEKNRDDAKRRMYALEKKLNAGVKLSSIELDYLLTAQEKFGRPVSYEFHADTELRPIIVETVRFRPTLAMVSRWGIYGFVAGLFLPLAFGVLGAFIFAGVGVGSGVKVVEEKRL
jgi:hypothetical protein